MQAEEEKKEPIIELAESSRWDRITSSFLKALGCEPKVNNGNEIQEGEAIRIVDKCPPELVNKGSRREKSIDA